MTLLKRSKSLADLFRPRSRSSGRAAAAAANPRSHASQTTASSCSDADSSRPATDAYARQANLRSSSSSPTSTRRPPPPPMIRTNTGASNADMSRSGTVEDILTAYYADSPTKSRHTPISPDFQYSSQRQQQQQQSPTRTRGPAALGQLLPKRIDSSGSAFQDGDDDDDDREDSIRQVLPSLPHHDTELARARKEAEANKLQAQQLKSSQRSSRSGRPSQNRSKSSNDLDLIDRLDISGLYGGGGFIRHEGPYAAASTKGQGANAPINAFDPSAFSLAPSQPARRPSKRNVSNGAASGRGRSAGAMIGGLDDPASRSLLSPYAAAAMVPTMSTSSTSSAAGGTGGGSSSEVSLGFPARHPDGKGQQLQEIYGVRDAEAWEDYGRARYDDSSVGTGDASGAASGAASRESVLPGGPVSKEDRMQRAQSIWDIEATLKAGKPVGVSNAPPPVPVMPPTWGSPSAGSDFSASTSTSPSLSTNNHNNNKPKRSKSLAARFRAGRKNPTNPLSDGDSPGPGGGEDGRHAGTAYESDGARSVPVSPTEDRRGRNEWPLGASVPASMGSSSTAPHSYAYPGGAVASPPASSNGHGHGGVEQLEIRTQAIKFDESLSSPTLERTSAGMMSRSLTDEGLASPTSASGGKKGHGLKRLFSTKRKA